MRRKPLCCAAAAGRVAAGRGVRRPAPRRRPARGQVRVAAAADLNAALGDLIMRFSAAHDVDVSVSYGSSGTFYAQLLNQRAVRPVPVRRCRVPATARGARADAAAAASSPTRSAASSLWAPAASPLDVEHDGLQALTRRVVAHVAIANPEHAPYGRAAVAAMQSAGVYERGAAEARVRRERRAGAAVRAERRRRRRHRRAVARAGAERQGQGTHVRDSGRAAIRGSSRAARS